MDPFSLVADELSLLTNRLRSMVVAEVYNLFCGLAVATFMMIDDSLFRLYAGPKAGFSC